jgi:O-antigen ligase
MLLGKFLLFSIPFERVIFFEISIFYWIGLIYILSTVIQLNIYKRSILKYAFAYMLIQIISITWSVEIYKTVEHAVKISFFVTLLFALNSKLKNTFNLSDLLKFYLYGYFTSIVFVLMDYYAQGGGGRLQGYNGIDSNSFALMSVFALYSIKRCGIRIKYAFLLNVVAISMVFLTFSRSGVLGLAIYYMYLYFHEEKSVSFKKFFLIIFIFLIVFLMIDYRSSLEYTDLASVTSGRSVFIEMALDLIKNDFISGLGGGVFSSLSSINAEQYVQGSWYEGRKFGGAAHNTAIEIFVGTGLLGLSVFTIFLVKMYKGILFYQDKAAFLSLLPILIFQSSEYSRFIWFFIPILFIYNQQYYRQFIIYKKHDIIKTD